MPGRGLVWPLLAYGVIGAIAAARPGGRLGGGGATPNDGSAERLEHLRRGDGRGANKKAERHHQSAHGRRADAPWQIPLRGWKDILWRVYAKINNDRLFAVAAGVVFYAILALFPALAALVSLYGLFADAHTIESTLSLLSGVLPGGAMDILHEELRRLTANGGSGLSLGFVFGLLIALWSANSGTKAVIDALNVAYEEKEERSFIRLNLVSLAFTLGGIAALMVAVSAVVIVPIVLNSVGLGSVANALIAILRWPALVLFIIAGLAVLYRYAPNRREPRWVWLSVGSAFAAIVWLVASLLFSWYIANFGNYNVTYGSLGAAIGMMVWMWISMIVVLIGAELNAEIEHQTARDSTVGGDKPIGKRGAKKADTIGAPQ